MKPLKRFLSGLLKFYSGNPAGIIGSTIVALILVACLSAPVLTDNEPNKRVARGHQPPSTELVFGSTRAGKDVYTQVLYGGRVSLMVAFSAATVTTIIALGVGVSSGYFGGRIDEVMMAITNVMLVFPQLPLLIILAAFLGNVGPLVIAMILGLTSWPWGGAGDAKSNSGASQKGICHRSRSDGRVQMADHRCRDYSELDQPCCRYVCGNLPLRNRRTSRS